MSSVMRGKFVCIESNTAKNGHAERLGMPSPKQDRLDKVEAPVVVAVILILVASFVFGIMLQSATLTRLGRRIESSVLGKLPMYSAIRRLTRGLAGADNTDRFRSAPRAPV